MKKILLLSTLIACALQFTFAQNTLSSNASSDPEARRILDKMKAKYEAYSSMQVDFSLEIKLPEEPEETQDIRLYKKGSAYRVEMPGRTVISDGETIWLIQDRNQDVQINNVPDSDEDTGILSPEALFSIHERDDFAFVLVGSATENGKVVQYIEFKPLAEYSEYAKLRLTLLRDNQEMVSVEAFGKDGSRYTIRAKSIKPNPTLDANLFQFDKKDYPGYYIEDLRY